MAVADTPSLTVFEPHGRPNGTAVIIAPGGAYLALASDLEGREVADWFASRGVTAFVLRYRLGGKYPMPTPLLDAQRAVRLVRSMAGDFDLSTNRIGMMGFSAGGHLTALTGVSSDSGASAAADPVERASSRPDFLILAYPALIMFGSTRPTAIDYCQLMRLQSRCDHAFVDRYRPELQVDTHTPPTFLYHTTDDELVPVNDSVRFYAALVSAGVSAEMHLFAHGHHGSGLGQGDVALDAWPTLLETWLRGQGLLGPNPNRVSLVGASIPVARNQRLSIDSPVSRVVADPRGQAVLADLIDQGFLDMLIARAPTTMSLRDIAKAAAMPDTLRLAAIQKALAALDSPAPAK